MFLADPSKRCKFNAAEILFSNNNLELQQLSGGAADPDEEEADAADIATDTADEGGREGRGRFHPEQKSCPDGLGFRKHATGQQFLGDSPSARENTRRR